MKRTLLLTITSVLSLSLLLLLLFSSCGKEGPAGPQGPIGPQGSAGVNGTNGLDGKSAYELAVEKGYTGTLDEWLAGLVGETGATGPSGANGKDGKDGQDGTNGKDGANGKDGVSVMGAYVDENLHLWIVLSNGSKIDAGYVGVSTTPSTPAVTDPTIIVSSSEAQKGQNDVEITVALKNNPGITSALLKVAFDQTALTLRSVTYNTHVGGQTIPPQTLDSPVTLYWTDGFQNVSTDFVLVTLTFSVSASAEAGDYDISVTYAPDDVYNADEENVEFDIINGKITVS